MTVYLFETRAECECGASADKRTALAALTWATGHMAREHKRDL